MVRWGSPVQARLPAPFFMRNNIVHPGADSLTYAIREIVDVADHLRTMGVPIYFENIGDPIAKGQTVPAWIKEIVSDLAKNDDRSYGYSPTRGMLATREFLAQTVNAKGGAQITPEDILFFNGLGDAIQTSFFYLHPKTRVIGPNPAYPTYSSAESAHADARHITYALDPRNGWKPDIADLRAKIELNRNIDGILIINPDNPTGMVYPREILEEIVAIAREYDLFIMSDEIYGRMTYNGHPMVPLSEVIGEVPGIAFKGLSKEVPWPGARCGWIEVYNRERDPIFARYVKSLVDAKMLEVCSTTLPQMALPKIYAHPEYPKHLKETTDAYGRKADMFEEAFAQVPEVIANKPSGAFYASVVFKDGVLREDQTLPIADEAVRAYVEPLIAGAAPDKRFVYYLMASTGITVVPLSGMNSHLNGFRITLLEPDEGKFKEMLARLVAAVRAYLAS